MNRTLAIVITAAALAVAGCDRIGPFRDHHPEAAANSASKATRGPGEAPLLNTRTGQPMRPDDPENHP